MHVGLFIVGLLVVFWVLSMLDPDVEYKNSKQNVVKRHIFFPTYRQIPQPLDSHNQQAWSGQQYVEPSRCDSMYDIENDDGHSGFQGNVNFHAPKFIAGLTALPDDPL